MFALAGQVFWRGHGRPVALVLLIGLAVLALFPDNSPLKAARLALFDQYQSVFPRERVSAPVTIVDIDEASLRRFGQWPWPRDRTAALVRTLAALGPAAIGLDIYMPERDATSPAMLAQRLESDQTGLRDALMALPDHDRVLAQALSDAPTVLGAAGFDLQTQTTSTGLKTALVRVAGSDPLPFVRRFPFVLASLPELQAAAPGQGLLSVDLEGGIVRRIPLVMAVGDVLVPSLAMEMLRVATGSDAVEVEAASTGVVAARVADLRVATQPNAEVWMHFGKADAARYVSAERVLNGTAPADMIRDKLVLIGLSGFGLVDSRVTPLRERVPGVDIQAQLIENLFDGSTLLRPAWMLQVEVALLSGMGLFLIWAVPVLRAPIATLIAAMLAVAVLGGGAILFRHGGLLFDAASVLFSIGILLSSLLASAFIESEQQRRVAEAALQLERESAARFAGELAAARRIQLGTLPRADVLFANERRFEIAALLEPAREVGGDLYDFFMLDENRLFFVVGDVSGKGIPASLFMAVTKALAKSTALRANLSLGDIIASTSREIARENPEMLFVTMLAGILDAANGDVELCIAGHDAPWRLGGDGLSRIEGLGGPPLCVLEDFDYPTVHSRLMAGESLCIVTDGVTEAMNATNEPYGVDRVDRLLRTLPASATAQSVLDAVRHDVSAFVGDAVPSDDLTLLIVRRHVIDRSPG